jgi:hypothetical protein
LTCPSLFGDMYFLTFINDYNKKKLGCFFQKKDWSTWQVQIPQKICGKGNQR